MTDGMLEKQLTDYELELYTYDSTDLEKELFRLADSIPRDYVALMALGRVIWERARGENPLNIGELKTPFRKLTADFDFETKDDPEYKAAVKAARQQG